MEQGFNPYREWLELDGDIAFPNYYQLLGLRNGESNPQEIAQAADRAVGKVRKCRPGEYAARWAQMLDELQSARNTLLDVDRKADYDRLMKLASSPPFPAKSNPPTPVNIPAPTASANLYPPGFGSTGGASRTTVEPADAASNEQGLLKPKWQPAGFPKQNEPIASTPSWPPSASPTAPATADWAMPPTSPTPITPGVAPSYSTIPPAAPAMPPNVGANWNSAAYPTSSSPTVFSPAPNFASPPDAAVPSSTSAPQWGAGGYGGGTAPPNYGYPDAQSFAPPSGQPPQSPPNPNFAPIAQPPAWMPPGNGGTANMVPGGYYPPQPAVPPTMAYGGPAYGSAAPPETAANYGVHTQPVGLPDFTARREETNPLYGFGQPIPNASAPMAYGGTPAQAPAMPTMDLNLAALTSVAATATAFDPTGLPQPMSPSAPQTGGMMGMNGMAMPVGMGSPGTHALPMGVVVGSNPVAANPAPIFTAPATVAAAPSSFRPRARATQFDSTKALPIILAVAGIVVIGLAIVAANMKGSDSGHAVAHSGDTANHEGTGETKHSVTKPEHKVELRPEIKVEPRIKSNPRSEGPPEIKIPDDPDMKGEKPEMKPEVKPEPIPVPAPKPEPKPEPPPESMPKASRQELVALGNALQNARQALADRNLDAADQELGKAAALAKDKDHRNLVERAKLLRHYTGEFWKAVKESMAKTQAPAELELGGTIVAIAQASAEEITIKSGPELKRYTIATLPMGVARALATKYLNASDKATNIILGASFAVSGGQADKAKDLWEKAKSAGANLEDLPLVLDDKYELTGDLVEFSPRPADALLAEAENKLRDIVKDELAKVKEGDKKLAVAEQLRKRATATNDAAERFLLFRYALQLSAQSGGAELYGRVATEFSKWFEVDILQEKADALGKAMTNTALTAAAAKEMAKHSLDALEEALKLQRGEAADKLAKAATKFAALSKDADLIKKAKEKGIEASKVAGMKSDLKIPEKSPAKPEVKPTTDKSAAK